MKFQFSIIKTNRSVVMLLAFCVLSYILILACANRGSGPQGGPKDITPPKPLKSTPNINALNYKKNRIEIIFDENIQLEKTFDNVVISPPQKQAPVAKAIGKKLLVELKDTLKANTTYTINFGDAIVDNNEKNVLSGYVFSFSTGNYIDSLQISGYVLDAQNLNPVSNVFVGIHSDLSDSAFLKKPFDRIAKTDKSGRFSVKNVGEGKYRVYSLNDIGNNFIFDQPNEQISFLDSIFVPNIKIMIKNDTVWRDSINKVDNKQDTIKLIDKIKSDTTRIYSPDSVVLRAFTEEFHKQYLVKSERKDQYHFSLFFNDINENLPKIEALNFPFDDEVFIQTNERKDSITYWLKDSLAWNTDTLKIKLTYLKTDSLNKLESQTDTLLLRSKNKKQDNQKQKKNQKNVQEFLKINTNTSASFNYFDSIAFSFQTPTELLPEIKIKIEQKIDTIYKEEKFTLAKGDSVGLKYIAKVNFKAGGTYRISVDSASFVDIYGKVNNKFSTTLTCKPQDSYSSLTLEMGFFTGKEIVELLDKNDKVLKTIKVTQPKIKFSLLDEGIYYARLFVDENSNGKWDTGDYKKNIQPEAVYYYPYYFELRQMWDLEEYWDYLEFPIIEQKPKELIKDTKIQN